MFIIKGVVYGLLGLMALMFIGGAVSSYDEYSDRAAEEARVAALTPEQRQAEIEAAAKHAQEVAEQNRIAAKEKEDAKVGEGAMLLLAVSTISSLRDPASFEVINAIMINGKKSKSVCMEYRARNGFGGMNSEYSMLTWKDGDTADKMRLSSNNEKQWNNHCVGKGHSYTAFVRYNTDNFIKMAR